MTWSHVFSRAWRRLHAFASNSDWFIALFTSVVIGQSNYFGFGFTTLNGPFAASGHMVHAGGQAAHWDIQNKATSSR